MPFKTFAAGEEATAADVNTYLAKQAVATFPTAAARQAAVTAPVKGQMTARDDALNRPEVWDGAAWVNPFPVDYHFSKVVALTVTAGASQNYSLVIPVSPLNGAIILDCWAKCDSGSGTFSQNLTLTIDPTSSVAPNTQSTGTGTVTSALASLQVRCIGLWSPIARAQALTAVLKLANAGGAGAINFARLEGLVRFQPVISAF